MKKTISLVMIVLLLLSWYTSVNTYFGMPGEYKTHLENAEKYEEKEIYEDAIAEYEAAQALLNERSMELDIKIAHDYLAMSEPKDYVSTMEDIINSYEDCSEAVVELTAYYVENGKNSKAVELLQKSHKKYPKNEVIADELDKLKGSYTSVYARYTEMSRIINGYAVVKSEDGYGVINSNGDALTNAVYEAIGVFGDKVPYAPVCEEGKWFYINSDIHKKLVPDRSYDLLSTFSEEKAVASRDGKYGYLNEDMEEVCEFEYEAVSNFCNEVAAVKKDGKWAIVDYKFREITKFKYDDVIMDELGYCSIGKRIFVKEDGFYKIIDTEGHEVSDLQFEDAYPFMASGQPAAVKQDGKWGFADEDGQLCIECTYDNAKSFSIDFAPVEKNGKWGYIDLENKLSISCEFSDATPFYKDGTAAVKNEEKWRLIKLDIYQ